MTYNILNVPVDSKEIKEFIDMLKLKSDMETYRNRTIQHMREHWGEDLGEEQSGYIDATIEVVEDGNLQFPFKHFKSQELDTYLANKIGDFSLYGRLWNSSPSEYEIDIPYNIGTADDAYWVDMSLSLDGNFNVTSATFSYDTDEPSNKYLTYWIMKSSN